MIKIGQKKIYTVIVVLIIMAIVLNIIYAGPIKEKLYDNQYYYAFNIDYHQLIKYKKIKGLFNEINPNDMKEYNFDIYYNDNIIKLNNKVYIKDNIVCMELEDFCREFNIDFNSKIRVYTMIYLSPDATEVKRVFDHKYLIPEMKLEHSREGIELENEDTSIDGYNPCVSAILEKNETSIEVIYNISGILKNGIKADIIGIPVAPFFLKDNNRALFYIPISHILKELGYNVDFELNTQMLKINHNDERRNMRWQDIYIEAIKSNHVEDFSLCDINNDGIPELLLPAADSYGYPYNNERKDLLYLDDISYSYSLKPISYFSKPYNGFWLNPNTNLLEEKILFCIKYDKNSNVVLTQHENHFYEYSKWEENKNDFIFGSNEDNELIFTDEIYPEFKDIDDKKSAVNESAKKFINYNLKDMEDKGISLEETINKYPEGFDISKQ